MYMREIIKRIGALLKIIAPLSDPPSEKVDKLKNLSSPGIEPGSMAWNAIALATRPRRPYSGLQRLWQTQVQLTDEPTSQPYCAHSFLGQ